MKKVLIFGISGFVGEYLANEFLENDYLVFGCDSIKKEFQNRNIKFKEVDILDENQVSVIIQEIKPNMIVNLAAISSVGLSWSIPQKTLMINVIGTINILESAKDLADKPRILFIGSSEEYVISDFPMSEDRQLDASNPYGISKVTQEQIAKIYREHFGMKIFCARAFNHTGVGQKDSFVLPSFCKQVVNIEKSGTGGIIKVGNLDIRRDFSHVKDIVKAYRCIIESENDSLVYNVGFGRAYKLRDMLEYIISLSHASIDIEVDTSRIRPIDQPVICCDRSLISNQLGWEPKLTVFDALTEMMDYYRRNL